MAKISQLYNENKEKIYPVTSSDSVINPDTGYPISDQIKENSNAIKQLRESSSSSSTSVAGNIVPIVLSKSGWSATSKTQTVSVTGITEEEDYQIIQIAPSMNDINNVIAYNNASITAISQAYGKITFYAEIIPTEDISLLISYTYTKQYIGDCNTAVTAVTTTGTGEAYVASVPNVDELTNGLQITIIPHVVSTTKDPTLNVNGLGAKKIKLRVANNLSEVVSGNSESWLAANKPIILCYDGTQWVTNNIMNVESIPTDLVEKVNNMDNRIDNAETKVDQAVNQLEETKGQLDVYNQHWWRIRPYEGSCTLKMIPTIQMGTNFYDAATASNGTKTNKVNILECWSRNNGDENDGSYYDERTIEVASNITVDSSGKISLVNSSSYPITGETFYSNKDTFGATISGKYVKGLASNPSAIYKINTSSIYVWRASITVSGENTVYTDYYVYAESTQVAVAGHNLTTGNYEYISNDDENFYPHSGITDRVEYQYLGKIYDIATKNAAYNDVQNINITSANWNDYTLTVTIPVKKCLIWIGYKTTGTSYTSSGELGLIGFFVNDKIYAISPATVAYSSSKNYPGARILYIDGTSDIYINNFRINNISNGVITFKKDSSSDAIAFDIFYLPLP